MNLTPEGLANAIANVHEALHRTVMIHPVNVPLFQEWLLSYEFRHLVAVVPNYAVPMDKILIIPTLVLDKPAWMTR